MEESRHPYASTVSQTPDAEVPNTTQDIKKPPDPEPLKDSPRCPKCAAKDKIETTENDTVFCKLCDRAFSWEEQLVIRGFKKEL